MLDFAFDIAEFLPPDMMEISRKNGRNGHEYFKCDSFKEILREG